MGDGPPAERDLVAEALTAQAEACRMLGSPLYGALLDRAAEDARVGGPVWRLLAPHAHDPGRSLPGLRLMGAVHRLVLEGRAAALAHHYPSAGGRVPRPGREGAVWGAFRETLADPSLPDLIRRPVQTNEVGRSRALLGGFLACAGAFGLPLHLLEIGSSAGLNLRWDRYRYESGEEAWGDPASPVRFEEVFDGPGPPLDAPAEVASRRACDTWPIDPTTEEGALTLLSYVWPDQEERIAHLRGAIEVARAVPARIEEADAVEWLGRELAEPPAGGTTVVFHSILLWYFDPPKRERVRDILIEAGGRATKAAPLAWLSMESGGALAEVRLTTWPGGEERLLAEAGYHGRPVRWLDSRQAG